MPRIIQTIPFELPHALAPCRTLRISPATSIVRRCLVIACRVTSAPVAKEVIDKGPSRHRRKTSRSRVSSPNAANNGAAVCAFILALALRGLRKVFLDHLDHHVPSAFVRLEGLRPA